MNYFEIVRSALNNSLKQLWEAEHFTASSKVQIKTNQYIVSLQALDRIEKGFTILTEKSNELCSLVREYRIKSGA